MKNRSAPDPCRRDDLRIDRGLGVLVGSLLHDHAGVIRAETGLQPDEVVLAEVVVGVEHRDLGVRLGRQNVLGVDARLRLVAGVVADRPGKMLRVVPLGRAGGDEELRHLFVVAIGPDRGVGRSAQRLEQERHLFLLDETADLLDRLRRAVAVVEADQIDLAAIDPALLVDHLEIGGLGAPDHAIGGSRAAIGHGLPDLDLGVGDAWRVGGAGGTRTCGEGRGGGARLQE